MEKLIVKRIGDLKTEKVDSKRSDGKVNRQFYTLYFADAGNPLTGNAQRNFYQSHNLDGTAAFWKDADYSTAKALVGQQIEGSIVRQEVEPYDINGRTATSFTCVVLKGEDAATIAKQNGHIVTSGAISASLLKEKTV